MTISEALLCVVTGWCAHGLFLWARAAIPAYLDRRRVPDSDAVEAGPQKDLVSPAFRAYMEELDKAEQVPEVPTIEVEGEEKPPEKATHEQRATLFSLKNDLIELQEKSAADASGMDLQGELDSASRRYGEAYYDVYHKAPPEWQ